MPATMAVVNIGLFGAAAGGPLVASGVAATGAWRSLLFGLAVVGVCGSVRTWRTLLPRPGFNPQQAVNFSVFPLAIAGTALPFFGATQLAVHSFGSPLVWVPLVAGVGGLVVLVVRPVPARRGADPGQGAELYPARSRLRVRNAAPDSSWACRRSRYG